MKATFVELPPFERTRKDYMGDEAYMLLQLELMEGRAKPNAQASLLIRMVAQFPDMMQRLATV